MFVLRSDQRSLIKLSIDPVCSRDRCLAPCVWATDLSIEWTKCDRGEIGLIEPAATKSWHTSLPGLPQKASEKSGVLQGAIAGSIVKAKLKVSDRACQVPAPDGLAKKHYPLEQIFSQRFVGVSRH